MNRRDQAEIDFAEQRLARIQREQRKQRGYGMSRELSKGLADRWDTEFALLKLSLDLNKQLLVNVVLGIPFTLKEQVQAARTLADLESLYYGPHFTGDGL